MAWTRPWDRDAIAIFVMGAFLIGMVFYRDAAKRRQDGSLAAWTREGASAASTTPPVQRS